jgi:DNA-directed RNA polymerase subunit RPC12/RpoP
MTYFCQRCGKDFTPWDELIIYGDLSLHRECYQKIDKKEIILGAREGFLLSASLSH